VTVFDAAEAVELAEMLATGASTEMVATAADAMDDAVAVAAGDEIVIVGSVAVTLTTLAAFADGAVTVTVTPDAEI
jgi:hypothetical protein